MPGGDHYRLYDGERPAPDVCWVGDSSDDVIDNALPYPAVTDTSTRTFQPGNYDWFVEAFDEEGGYLGSSPVSTFRIADFPRGDRPVHRARRRHARRRRRLRRHLDPNGVSGAICDDVPRPRCCPGIPIPGIVPLHGLHVQRLQLHQPAGDHRPGHASPRTTPPRSPTSRATYPDSQAGQSYFWLIRPCKAVNVCATDPVSSPGKATNAFRKQSPGIELLTPTADASPAAPNLDDQRDHLRLDRLLRDQPGHHLGDDR